MGSKRKRLYFKENFIYFLILASIAIAETTDEITPRLKRQLLFPTPSSKVQWVIAIGIPATVDNKKLGFGLSLKLNYYTLPLNASDVVYPYIDIKNKRESDDDANAREDITPTEHPGNRWSFYEGLQFAIGRFIAKGENSEECLLRAICEAASSPFYSKHHGGLAGELLHVLFTPSVTPCDDDRECETSVATKYQRAESLGKDGESCGSAFPMCRSSLLDLFSAMTSLPKSIHW